MAASAKGIKAGRAFVEIGTDNSKLTKGLRQAQQKLQTWGAGIAKIGGAMFAGGAAVMAPLMAAVNSFTSKGDAMAKMADRTGASVEALSGLGHAAEQSGASLEDVEKSIRKMQQNLVDAANGSKTATDALNALGLSAADLEGLSPDEQFKAIAEKISQIEDPAQRTAAALDIFGKSGANLMPLLRTGADGINELIQEAEDLGYIISTEDAQAAAKLGDVLANLWKSVQAGVFAIGASLAPLLTDMAERMMTIGTAALKWVQDNRELVVTIFKVAAGVMAAGAAITAIGIAFIGAGAAIGGVIAVGAVVATIFKAIAAAVLFVLSPVGLVVTALVGLGAWFLYSSGLGRKALDWLMAKFGELWKAVKPAFDAIKNAMKAGEFKKAAEVLWTGINLVWTAGVAKLETMWLQFKNSFLDIWDTVASALAKTWINLVAVLDGIWNSFVNAIGPSIISAVASALRMAVKLREAFDPTFGKNEALAANMAIFGAEAAATVEVKKDRSGEIEARRQEQLGSVDQMNEFGRSEREKAFAAAMAENAAEIAKAQAEFDQAIAEANAAGKEPPKKKGSPRTEDQLRSVGAGFRTAGSVLQAGQTETMSAIFKAMSGGGKGMDEKQLEALNRIAKEQARTRESYEKNLPEVIG